MMPGMSLSLRKEDLAKNKILLIGIAMAILCVRYGYNDIYEKAMARLHRATGTVSEENLKREVALRLERLQADIKSYKTIFPQEADMSWLTGEVSDIAKETRLEVKALNANPLNQLAGLKCSRVSLSVSGRFNNLGDFVSRVESSAKFMRIDTLSFKKNGESLDADIVVSTYFW